MHNVLTCVWYENTLPYPYLVNSIKNLATLKFIQLLRKFTCGHLWISAINAVSLKEIKGITFEYQTSKVFFVVLSITPW